MMNTKQKTEKIQYNIYRAPKKNLAALMSALKETGLKEQKNETNEGCKLTFYFSENNSGQEIWWWKHYRHLANKETPTPKNIFSYGLLIAELNDQPDFIYLISLGKSHFYLSRFIERDFGINFAIRMADGESILLKKSRYFAGTKKGDVSSYIKFSGDDFEPGESVDHLKLKAQDKELWGDGNIIFADSIQIGLSKKPSELELIIKEIQETLVQNEKIQLPKLEEISNQVAIDELDTALLQAIKYCNASASINDFEVFGVHINFRFDEYDYEIFTQNGREPRSNKEKIGSSLDIKTISDYIKRKNITTNIDSIKIKSSTDHDGSFIRSLKEVLDFRITHNGQQYFIKNGRWHIFNDTFITYLKRSLEKIPVFKAEDLDENHYQAWKLEKEKAIQRMGKTSTEESPESPESPESQIACINESNGEIAKDKILYREYYFNEYISMEKGYQLIDRQNKYIKSLRPDRKKYQFEVADLYNDGEIISVKISDDKVDLIYNITQSLNAIELLKQNTIPDAPAVNCAALWFVFSEKEEIKSILDYNSIHFLLAIENWRKRVSQLGMDCKIYLSQRVNVKTKEGTTSPEDNKTKKKRQRRKQSA